MPWRLPDEETRRRVNTAFGSDQYARLASVWDAALSQLPGPVPAYTQNQQLRTVLPSELQGVEGKADPTSVHYLGLARDVGWRAWPLAYKRQVASIIEQSGLAVERTGRGKLFRAHLHYGVPKTSVIAQGLLPMIQGITLGLSTVRAAERVAGR